MALPQGQRQLGGEVLAGSACFCPRCPDLRHWHCPGGRDSFKDWQLHLKMQILRLFNGRNPGAFARVTFTLAAGEWADGFLLASAQSCLYRVDPSPASLGLGCAGLMTIKSVAACLLWLPGRVCTPRQLSVGLSDPLPVTQAAGPLISMLQQP